MGLGRFHPLASNLPGGDFKAIPDVSLLRRYPSANFMCLLFLAPVIDGNFHR